MKATYDNVKQHMLLEIQQKYKYGNDLCHALKDEQNNQMKQNITKSDN